MKISKLISLVKERPVLYDLLHPLSKDRKEKDKMWGEISTAMNLHTDIARGRWKSLKDCYTKYLKSTMATGPTAYLKYINWQWAEHMEFIKPHIKFGLIITNIQLKDNQETDDLGTQSSSDVQGYQSSSEVLETYDRSETPEASATPDKPRTHEKSTIHDRNGTHEMSITQENVKTHEKSRTHERTLGNIRRRRRAVMVSPNVITSPNSDRIVRYVENKKTDKYSATELIFLGYAKSIKAFSIRRQAQVKMKIAKIMMEEEIAHFEETMSHSEY